MVVAAAALVWTAWRWRAVSSRVPFATLESRRRGAARRPLSAGRSSGSRSVGSRRNRERGGVSHGGYLSAVTCVRILRKRGRSSRRSRRPAGLPSGIVSCCQERDSVCVIEHELKQAHCVIVLWSRISVESEWVIDEAEWAQEHGRLVLVLIDDVETPTGLQATAGRHAGRLGGRRRAP